MSRCPCGLGLLKCYRFGNISLPWGAVQHPTHPPPTHLQVRGTISMCWFQVFNHESVLNRDPPPTESVLGRGEGSSLIVTTCRDIFIGRGGGGQRGHCPLGDLIFVYWGFNASATTRVKSRRWNDDDEISFLVEETGVPRGNHRPTASNWWNWRFDKNITGLYVPVCNVIIVLPVCPCMPHNNCYLWIPVCNRDNCDTCMHAPVCHIMIIVYWQHIYTTDNLLYIVNRCSTWSPCIPELDVYGQRSLTQGHGTREPSGG